MIPKALTALLCEEGENLQKWEYKLSQDHDARRLVFALNDCNLNYVEGV